MRFRELHPADAGFVPLYLPVIPRARSVLPQCPVLTCASSVLPWAPSAYPEQSYGGALGTRRPTHACTDVRVNRRRLRAISASSCADWELGGSRPPAISRYDCQLLFIALQKKKEDPPTYRSCFDEAGRCIGVPLDHARIAANFKNTVGTLTHPRAPPPARDRGLLPRCAIPQARTTQFPSRKAPVTESNLRAQNTSPASPSQICIQCLGPQPLKFRNKGNESGKYHWPVSTIQKKKWRAGFPSPELQPRLRGPTEAT